MAFLPPAVCRRIYAFAAGRYLVRCFQAVEMFLRHQRTQKTSIPEGGTPAGAKAAAARRSRLNTTVMPRIAEVDCFCFCHMEGRSRLRIIEPHGQVVRPLRYVGNTLRYFHGLRSLFVSRRLFT